MMRSGPSLLRKMGEDYLSREGYPLTKFKMEMNK